MDVSATRDICLWGRVYRFEGLGDRHVHDFPNRRISYEALVDGIVV